MVKQSNQQLYDVVVVGGGAAGLIAATTAARNGAQVLLLEKNRILGKKLRITGGGRCNITNNTESVRALLSRYGEAGKFLFSPFAQFGVKETRAWFDDIGVATVVEAEARVFPVSQSAVAVTEALIAAVKQAGVTIRTNAAVLTVKPQAQSFAMGLTSGEVMLARQVLIATGGLSRPETGSSGDALPWLASLGHTINTPQVALVPVAVKETTLTKRLSGVALKEAGIIIRQAGRVLQKGKGKVLFTHIGLSGPGILNMSQVIGDALTTDTVEIGLDLTPSLPSDVLEDLLLERIMAAPNKHIQNQWSGLVPGALVAPILALAQVDPHTPGHSVTIGMRRALVQVTKCFSLTVSHLLGADKAVVTSGGVALSEIDFRTMESRIIPGLFVVGDVLDINRPSGGYSLQLAWTTGFVAGLHASKKSHVQHRSKNNN
ncbi:MAG: hypothetical protein RLZZ360_842 [Candidatus Parcubacteria bacterium]|jgi:predicted Rossmann fold flavoprotein